MFIIHNSPRQSTHLAVNLALILITEGAVQPLVAVVALEAGLVPLVPTSDLLLGSKHGLGTGRTSSGGCISDNILKLNYTNLLVISLDFLINILLKGSDSVCWY